MLKVALYNLGCKVNSYEADVMQQNLQENGFMIVPFDEKADIYLVNTCTVTNIADQKSRKKLHQARKANPDAIVVAVGCFVQVEEEALKETSIDLAIGNYKKNELVPILNEYLKNRPLNYKTLGGKTIIDINKETTYEEMSLTKISSHTRAFIKIQDGCNEFCSYCIIPYARGRVRSRREESIKSELTKLVNAGNREVVLTGINLSSYGDDFNDKNALLRLLNNISDIPNLSRIRLGSLEPRLITDEFIKEITNLPKVCPHFHLSLQSGSDTVLKRMNRHYTTAEYYEKAKLIKEAYQTIFGKEPALTTDIIVGFPGETKEEFTLTEEFVRKVGFSAVHIFKYSKRKGTKAASMPNQITAAEKKARSLRLHEISSELTKRFMGGYIGKDVTVILEEEKMIGGTKYLVGYTAEYLRVALPPAEFPDGQPPPGLMVSAIITGFLADDILITSLRPPSRNLNNPDIKLDH